METILILLILLISLIFILIFIWWLNCDGMGRGMGMGRGRRGVSENFTVDFIPYQEPYFGFCYPNLTQEEYDSGNYDTHCWANFALEDCDLLNKNKYNCGRNLKTGEPLPCYHNTGKCKDEPQCFSTCYEQVGKCKEPYMIKVTRDNLIGLGAA